MTGGGSRRRTASRVVSAVLALGAIAGLLWWIEPRRDAVWHAVGSISPAVLLAAAALVGGGSMLNMLAWRELAVPYGGRLGVRTASAFFFSTQLGKYLPGGGLWPLVAQSYLADTLNMSRAQMITAFSAHLVLSMLTGAALAAGVAPAIAMGLWWIPLLAVLGFLMLLTLPSQVVTLLSRLPRLGSIDAHTAKALGGQIRRSACYSAAGWTVNGLHVSLLTVATGGSPGHTLYPAVAALALATVLSSAAVFFPGGIGPRDLILVGVLSRLVDQPSALAIAAVSRLLTTLVELALAAMFRKSPSRSSYRNAREERNMSARRYDLTIVLNYYYPYLSGVAEVAKVLAEGLTQRGFAVAVVTTQHDDRLARRERINGVDVFRAPIVRKIGRGFLSPAFTRIARQVARQSRLLNVHLPMLEAAMVVRGIGDTPVVSTYHIDVWMPPSPLSAALTRVVNASVSHALKASIAVAVYSQDQIVQSVHRKTLAGANLHAILAPCTDRRGGTPRFRETRGRHIGFLGRIVADKGIDALVRAFRMIDDPDARLLIAGDYSNVAGGSTIDLVRAEAAGDDRVRILGPLTGSRIDDFYASIDVFGLPSVVESFGIAQAEAIMTGVPSVTVNLPGGRVPVTETGLGVLVEPGADTAALHSALCTAAKIPAERRQQAASKARDQFSTQRFLDAYEALLIRHGIDAPAAAQAAQA